MSRPNTPDIKMKRSPAMVVSFPSLDGKSTLLNGMKGTDMQPMALSDGVVEYLTKDDIASIRLDGVETHATVAG